MSGCTCVLTQPDGQGLKAVISSLPQQCPVFLLVQQSWINYESCLPNRWYLWSHDHIRCTSKISQINSLPSISSINVHRLYMQESRAGVVFTRLSFDVVFLCLLSVDWVDEAVLGQSILEHQLKLDHDGPDTQGFNCFQGGQRHCSSLPSGRHLAFIRVIGALCQAFKI